MKDKVKVRFLLFAFVLLLLIGLIVDSRIPALAEPKPEGTLIVALASLGEEGFLPWIGAGRQVWPWALVYDWPLYFHHRTREALPGLAERWEQSQDGLTITVWLRKGIPWHDGWGEVSAEDMKFTLEQNARKGSTSSHAGNLRKGIQSMEVIDSHCLSIHLKKPDPTLWLHILAGFRLPAVMCKKYIETVGEDKAMRSPIGSGPYRLVEHKRGNYMKFEALEKHWRVIPEFKYITILIVPEESTKIAMLKTGEADLVEVSPAKVAMLEKAGLERKLIPGGYSVQFCFGGMLTPADTRYVKDYHRQDPWSDIRVREAMNIAIDRKAIAESIYYKTATPISAPLLWPGWDELELYPYDIKRAKRMLTEAGYPNGFKLTMAVFPQTPGIEIPMVGEAVAGYWEKIGIDVKIERHDSMGSFRPKVLAGKDGGYIWQARSAAQDDYTHFTKRYFAPNVFGGALSRSQDEGLTPIIRKLEGVLDMKEREAVSHEITKYMHANYGTIPIVAAHSVWMFNKEKVGEWPVGQRSNESYFEYIRHVKPLNMWRLFSP